MELLTLNWFICKSNSTAKNVCKTLAAEGDLQSANVPISRWYERLFIDLPHSCVTVTHNPSIFFLSLFSLSKHFSFYLSFFSLSPLIIFLPKLSFNPFFTNYSSSQMPIHALQLILLQFFLHKSFLLFIHFFFFSFSFNFFYH